MLGKLSGLIDLSGVLDLFDYSFTKEDLENFEREYSRLSISLRDCPQVFKCVTGLRFGHSTIDPEHAEGIAAILRSSSCTVKRIIFVNNELGPDGVAVLADSLKNNATVSHLEIIDDNVTAAGARALADTIRNNSTLSTLLMQNCSVRSGSGIDALAGSLRMNEALKTLEYD